MAITQIINDQVRDNTITNAKIASNAAIAWSKIDKTGATGTDVGALLLQNGTPGIQQNGNTNINGTGLFGAISTVGDIAAGSQLRGSSLTVASNSFTVDNTGNLASIKSVTYVWPASNEKGILWNVGTGTLSWATDPYWIGSLFVESDAAGTTPLIIKGILGQTSNILSVVDSTDAGLFWVEASGATNSINFVGPLTGNVISTSVQLSNEKLTVGTLTASKEAVVRTTVSKYTWTNADVVLFGGSLVGDIVVATLPAKTRVKRVLVIVTGQATNLATLTGAVGITGPSYVDYLVPSNLKAAVNTVYGGILTDLGAALQSHVGNIPSVTATTDVKLHLISTGSNLDQCLTSAGEIYIETEVLP